MNQHPLISVITPIYGVEKFIERSLQSLFSQTLAQRTEFILVNDCTPDASMDIARRVVAQFPVLDVRIVEHEANRGSAAARQTGIDLAKGEYTIHFDSDDWCEPQMLQRMYGCAVENEADIVICDYFNDYPDRREYVRQEAPDSGTACIRELLGGRLHGSLCNKLIARRLYTDNGIRFAEGVNMWEDLSTVVRLCYFAGKVAYLPQAFLHYVQYNAGSYTRRISERSLRNMVQAVDILEKFFIAQGAAAEFSGDLSWQKVGVKMAWFLHAGGKKRMEGAKLYPEADPYILRYEVYHPANRYALWMATKGWSRLSKGLVGIIRASDKIRRNI